MKVEDTGLIVYNNRYRSKGNDFIKVVFADVYTGEIDSSRYGVFEIPDNYTDEHIYNMIDDYNSGNRELVLQGRIYNPSNGW